MRRFFFAILLAGCSLGCHKKTSPPKNFCDYPQTFKTSHAWLVSESNGQPQVVASGFLVNRDKGIFLTARHFTDDYKQLLAEMKIFWNCRVYDADILRLPPTEDAALVILRKPFDSSNFPDALPIAKQPVRLGDTVYAVGFHPHPYLNNDLGYGSGRPTDILKNYYHQVTLDSTKLIEIVFDSLPGRVIELNAKLILHSQNKPTLFAAIQDSISRYTNVRITAHHNLSFAGLSGGALLNKDGEVVGIITAEELRFERDSMMRGENLLLPQGIFKIYFWRQIRDKVSVTPISAIYDLLKNLE